MLTRVRRFRRQLQSSVGPRGPGRRYPAELRTEALEIAAARRKTGASTRAVAKELGIPEVTLKRWAESAGDLRCEGRAPFHEVTVRGDPPPRPVLVLPNGARVEGLDIDGVVELIRRLG